MWLVFISAVFIKLLLGLLIIRISVNYFRRKICFVFGLCLGRRQEDCELLHSHTYGSSGSSVWNIFCSEHSLSSRSWRYSLMYSEVIKLVYCESSLTDYYQFINHFSTLEIKIKRKERNKQIKGGK